MRLGCEGAREGLVLESMNMKSRKETRRENDDVCELARAPKNKRT